MRARPALVALLVVTLVLAGCAQQGPPVGDGPDPGPAPTAPVAYGPATCDNGLLFQFVDYAVTDAFLPPGFHPRDPQAFLRTPAAFGQAGVLLVTLDCTADSGPMQAAFVGIFVEAPSVPDLDPAPFNFYELVRYGPSGDAGGFGGAMERDGWPVLPGNVTIQAGDRQADQPTAHIIEVTDAEGGVVWFGGATPSRVEVGDGPTRFWRQDSSGLAYVEYGARLDSAVGTGACSVRAGTPLANFVAPTATGLTCPSVDLSLTVNEPVIAVLLTRSVDATYADLDGVFPE